MRLGSSILKHTGSRGSAPAGGLGVMPLTKKKYKKLAEKLKKKTFEKKKCFKLFFFQKCLNIHETRRMCWNEWKINFLIFAILSFWDMVVFVLKIGHFRLIFSTKSTITQKIKFGIFHSIQHYAHLSCKYSHFWGREGDLHILSWEKSASYSFLFDFKQRTFLLKFCSSIFILTV